MKEVMEQMYKKRKVNRKDEKGRVWWERTFIQKEWGNAPCWGRREETLSLTSEKSRALWGGQGVGDTHCCSANNSEREEVGGFHWEYDHDGGKLSAQSNVEEILVC